VTPARSSSTDHTPVTSWAEVMLSIAAGIRAGGLSLSMGQDEVTVFPRGALELDVAARAKKDTSRIDIAIA
jgi:hypothetical protein